MSYFIPSEINFYFTYNSAKRTLTFKDINDFIRFWHCVQKPYCIVGTKDYLLFYICEKEEIKDIKLQRIAKFWRRLYRLVGYLNIKGSQFLYPRVYIYLPKRFREFKSKLLYYRNYQKHNIMEVSKDYAGLGTMTSSLRRTCILRLCSNVNTQAILKYDSADNVDKCVHVMWRKEHLWKFSVL
jgi:hypothetical protein